MMVSKQEEFFSIFTRTTQEKALEILDAEAQEMEIHRQYAEYYGYVFYVMQR